MKSALNGTCARLLALGLVLGAMSSTWAVVEGPPGLLNYQGRLTDSAGQPLATGLQTLTFRVYDAPVGGTLKWGPQVFDGVVSTGHGAQVQIVTGNFNVVLGPTDVNGLSIANAFVAANRYIEVAVGAGAPIAPRQQVLTAPYAMVAQSVKDGSIDANALANGAVTTSKLANGAVTSVQLAPELQPDPRSEIRVSNSNANGSAGSGNRVRVFQSIAGDVNVGSAITWVQDSINGDKFVINQNGIYSATFTFFAGGGSDYLGISLNSDAGTSLLALSPSNRLCMDGAYAPLPMGSCSWTGYLNAGDFLRAHSEGTAVSAPDRNSFRIIRVGK